MQRCGGKGGQGIPGNEEAKQAGAVRACQQHEEAKAQLEQEEAPHYGIDTPAPAQGQEVEVVEMRSNIGDAWGGKRVPLLQEQCHSLRGGWQLTLE